MTSVSRKPANKPETCACHEIDGTVNVMIKIDDEDADVCLDQIHAGPAEFEPDGEERAEEAEDRAAGADRRRGRRAEIDDAQSRRDQRYHVDEEHAPRPERILDEASEEPQRQHVDADMHQAAVKKRARNDAPPLTVLQHGGRIERSFLEHAFYAAASGRTESIPRPRDLDFPQVSDRR